MNMRDFKKEHDYIKQKFYTNFEKIEMKKFKSSEEVEEILSTIIFYFIGAPQFLTSPIINSNISEPSFQKGLLLIGNYGTGKTSIMKVVTEIFKEFKMFVKIKNTSEIVLDYECLAPNEKKDFFENLKRGTWVFDDLLNERDANNFGKTELFKNILEIRCDNKRITHATCNYDPDFPGDVEKGLKQFYTKYGGRIYDRLHEMFNIVEFKGKSMRR